MGDYTLIQRGVLTLSDAFFMEGILLLRLYDAIGIYSE